MANYSKSFVHQGMGTASSTKVPDAGIYFVDGKISLPMNSTGGGASAVVAVVNKNGSPVYTGSAGRAGFHISVSCAADDVITVVFSSALAIDNALNAVKSTITIGVGSEYAIS